MADGKYNIYSQQEIDERLGALEQKIIKPTVEKQLRIKTLPSLVEDLYAIPVVTPNAVQGTFPAFDGSEPTEKLDTFAQEVVSQFRTLSSSVTTQINEAIQNIEPSEGSSPIEIDQDTKDSLVANTITQIRAQNIVRDIIIPLLYPIDSIITTLDENFDPNDENNSIKKALGSSSKGERNGDVISKIANFPSLSPIRIHGNGAVREALLIDSNRLSEMNQTLQTRGGKNAIDGLRPKEYGVSVTNANGSAGNGEIYGTFGDDDGNVGVRCQAIGGGGTPMPTFYVTVFSDVSLFSGRRVE